MRINTTGFGLLAAVAALTFGTLPASAEFFGCHERSGRVLYSYNGTPSSYGTRSYSSRYTHEFAAQSSRYRVSHSRVTYVGSRHSWNNRPQW